MTPTLRITHHDIRRCGRTFTIEASLRWYMLHLWAGLALAWAGARLVGVPMTIRLHKETPQ